jgi:hypothetical protein
MPGSRPVASIPFLRDFEDEFGHGPIFASSRSSQKVAKLLSTQPDGFQSFV